MSLRSDMDRVLLFCAPKTKIQPQQNFRYSELIPSVFEKQEEVDAVVQALEARGLVSARPSSATPGDRKFHFTPSGLNRIDHLTQYGKIGRYLVQNFVLISIFLGVVTLAFVVYFGIAAR